MTLKDLVFTEGNFVTLRKIDDGDAVYWLYSEGAQDSMTRLLLEFKVPKEDLRGAEFKLHDSPKFFMRWIRKALELKQEEEQMIAQAKKDWEEGKQS